MTTVQNIHGTSNRRPSGADTWEEYWTQRKGPFTTCSNAACTNAAEVGAHVKKTYSLDNHWYIVPLCRACNNLTTPFSVPEGQLVPENE